MEQILEQMANALIAGKQDEVKKLAQDALDQGTAAKEILDNGLLAGMDVVGQRFKAGDMFIPEVLLCARCMHGAMDILKPLLSEADAAGARATLGADSTESPVFGDCASVRETSCTRCRFPAILRPWTRRPSGLNRGFAASEATTRSG